MKKNKKIRSEAESRKRVLDTATRLGCRHDVEMIFNKYDKLLKKCTNENERKHISVMGLVELHKFLQCSGPLVVNDQVVLPGADDTIIGGNDEK
jgi:hypothetical protein